MRVPDFVNKILHHRAFVPASIGVGSVSAGLGVGYVVGCKLTERRMLGIFARVMADTDVMEEGQDVDPNQMEIPFPPTGAALADYLMESSPEEEEAARLLSDRMTPPHLRTIGKGEVVPDHEHLKVVLEPWERLEHKPDSDTPAGGRTNVFRSASEWDQEAEEAQRTDHAPYIISKDEFFAYSGSTLPDDGWFQEDLVYYAGDDILTDSHDVPQYHVNMMVGELRFGHGSGEEHVVYVRNPKLKMEYSITRDPGSYEHEVLGEQAEAETLKIVREE